MTLNDIFIFALKSLTGYRLRTALMLMAMAIGVAAVVLLTALGESGRRYIISEFSALGTHMLIILPGRAETTGGPPPLVGTSPRDLTIGDALALLRSPTIRRIAPIIIGTATVSWRRRNREVLIIGSTPDMLAIRHLELAQGRFQSDKDPRRARPTAVIGTKIRKELFGPNPALGQRLRIGDSRFRVTGILADQGQAIGLDINEVIIIPVASAQRLFNAPSLFRILAEARSREAIPAAKRDILRIIRDRHDGEDDITVITQDSILATFDRILRALTLTIGGIAAISLLVAGILIMNVMLVTVSQRTQEIGLLKAIGAAAKSIERLFLMEAAVLSLTGAALGLICAQAGIWVIAGIYPDLPIGATWWAVLAATLTALVIGLVFGILPARRAARLDPVQALSRR